MAAKAKKYSIRIYGRRGALSASKLRYANRFAISYNGKTIVSTTPFPANVKTTDRRRNYLQRIIVQIETARARRLAIRRAQYRKRRIVHGEEHFKEKMRRRMRKPLTHVEEGLLKGFRETAPQVPTFSAAEALDQEILQQHGKNVLDAMVIPIEPDGKEYTKKIFDKTMDKDNKRYHVAVMDLTLDDGAQIPMTAGNFRETYQDSVKKLLPSVLRYFDETKASAQNYILRIKFLNRWDVDAEWENYGISYLRMHIREQNEIFNLFRQTFLQLFGSRDQYDLTAHKTLRTNYLMGDKEIMITGVTLEAANFGVDVSEHERFVREARPGRSRVRARQTTNSKAHRVVKGKRSR